MTTKVPCGSGLHEEGFSLDMQKKEGRPPLFRVCRMGTAALHPKPRTLKSSTILEP